MAACMAACMAALYGRKLALYGNLVPRQYFVPLAKHYIVIVFILFYIYILCNRIIIRIIMTKIVLFQRCQTTHGAQDGSCIASLHGD